MYTFSRPEPRRGQPETRKGIVMAPDRRAALTAGVLFIIATAASLLSAAVERPVLTGTDYLTRIAGNTGRVSAGGLLELVAAGASAGIAIALYPVLRKRSQGLALGAVIFRALEAVMYTVGAVITLSLLTVARQYAQAAALSHGGIRAIGDALTGVPGRDPGGRVRFCPGRPDVLLCALPLAPGPALAVGLGHRGRGPDPHRLPVGLVQPHPRDLLHDPDSSHRRAGDGPGGLADIPGIQPGRRPGRDSHRVSACWPSCGRRARPTRPPRWPIGCRRPACSGSSSSSKAAGISSVSGRRPTAARPRHGAGKTWTDLAGLSNT